MEGGKRLFIASAKKIIWREEVRYRKGERTAHECLIGTGGGENKHETQE